MCRYWTVSWEFISRHKWARIKTVFRRGKKLVTLVLLRDIDGVFKLYLITVTFHHESLAKESSKTSWFMFAPCSLHCSIVLIEKKGGKKILSVVHENKKDDRSPFVVSQTRQNETEGRVVGIKSINVKQIWQVESLGENEEIWDDDWV